MLYERSNDTSPIVESFVRVAYFVKSVKIISFIGNDHRRRRRMTKIKEFLEGKFPFSDGSM